MYFCTSLCISIHPNVFLYTIIRICTPYCISVHPSEATLPRREEDADGPHPHRLVPGKGVPQKSYIFMAVPLRP